MNTGRFTFEWAEPGGSGAGSPVVSDAPLAGHPPLLSRETEIFMPAMLSHSRNVVVEGLGPQDTFRHDEARQTLTVVAGKAAPGAVHRIVVSLDPPLKPAFEVNTFWGDFGAHITALGALFIAILFYLLFVR